MYKYVKTENGYKHSVGVIGTGVGSEIFNDYEDNIASGRYSHAEGYNTTASGYYSHAEGYHTTASGYYSHVEGRYTAASGDYSHAEGRYTTAPGYCAHAEGSNTNVDGGAMADRNFTLSDGTTATIKGSTAYGRNSHAEGTQTYARGYSSHAEGYGTFSEGECSHAEGGGTVASGYGSHAEGCYTTASGYYSHAEGGYTTASGDYSHAEGIGTTASGNYSHAEGGYTTASGNQHVQGHYNNTSTATAGDNIGTVGTAFVIGNGTYEAASNAFRVTYAGATYAKASYNSTGADYAEFFEWLDGNPNAEDRRGYFVTLDGDKIKIANHDDYILGIISGQPSVIGNADEDWMGRYIMDDFGSFITEEFEYEEKIHEVVMVEEEVEAINESIDTDEPTAEVEDKDAGVTQKVTVMKPTVVTKTVIKTGIRYKENPEYDSTRGYIQRIDRPEWDAVGMLGVLSVRDDGTCKVNGFCNVADDGIATESDTGYRVIKRVNDNVVKVIFK